MAGLGDLTSMMNMMNNRRQSRLDNEYRNSVLAQRGEQLDYQRGQDTINNAARDRQLAGYEQSVINQTQAQGIQNDAAAASQRTLDNSRIANDILPVLGEGLSFNSNGGISISDEGMASVLQNNMTAALKVMSNSSQFESLASSMGVKYDDITGLQPLSDGTFALIVKNGDTEGPLTVGGTSNNDDPITKLDQATVKRIFENGMGGVMNDGGFDSQASQIWATMGVDSARRAEIKGRREMESAVAGILQSDGAMLSQNGDTEGVDAIRRASLDINDMSYDDLAGIMADRGMSMEDIEAQFPRPAQEQVSSDGSPIQGMGFNFAANEDGTESAQIEVPEWASPKLKKLIKDRNTIVGSGGSTPTRGGLSAATLGSSEAQDTTRARNLNAAEQEIRGYAQGLKDRIQKLEKAGPSGALAATTGITNEKQLSMLRKELEGLDPSAVTPDSKLEGGIDAPNVTLTRENMIAKITEEGWTPTDNQRSQMSAYLQSQGVQSLQDLRKIPERETVLAAAILATSDRTATVAQQQELLQKTFNLIERGAMDYSLGDQIDDGANRATRNQTARTFAANREDEYNNRLEGLGDKLRTIAEQTDNDDIQWTDQEYVTNIRELARNFQQSRGDAKAQYGLAMSEAFGMALKKYAVQKRDVGLVERIQNIFRADPDADLTVDNVMDRVVVSPDGKTFGFVDPLDRDATGIVEGEIPIDEITELFGRDFTKFILNTASRRPPVAM